MKKVLKKEKALNTEEKAILTRGNALLLIVPFPFSSSYFLVSVNTCLQIFISLFISHFYKMYIHIM